MRFINQKARKVAALLLQKAQENGGHLKLDNSGGAFMAVIVEVLRETQWGTHFAIAHYYKQNGDLCPDPDMEFIRTKFGGEILPVEIRQTFGTREGVAEYDETGRPKRIYPRAIREMAVFAGMWMENIKHQQGLKP